MSHGFHRHDQLFQLLIGPPCTQSRSGAGWSAVAPSGSTSQARTGWPSSAVAVTSSSRPGSVTGTPGQSSAPGSAPVVRSMRTGVGGESTAARSAYRYRPSGSGFRSVYAPSSAVTRVTSPLPISTRNTGHRPPSSAVRYSALESGAQASPFGQRSQPAAGGVPLPQAGDVPPVGRDPRVLEVVLGYRQQHPALAAGHVDRDQVAVRLAGWLPHPPTGDHRGPVRRQLERLAVQRPPRLGRQVAKAGGIHRPFEIGRAHV